MKREKLRMLSEKREVELPMQPSSVALVCCLILCLTGGLRDAAKRLRIPFFVIPVSCGALLALSRVCVPSGALAGLRAAEPLALLLALIAALRNGKRFLLAAICVSFACGLVGRLFLGALPNAAESGLLLALPSILAAGALFGIISPRKASAQERDLAAEASATLLITQCAPLFYGVCVMLEDWFLFDLPLQSVASAIRFDAQTIAFALVTLLWRIASFARADRRPAKRREVIL